MFNSKNTTVIENSITTKEIVLQLKKILKNLKKQYKNICINSPDNKLQEVLYDNFYIIDKNLNSLLDINEKITLCSTEYGKPAIGSIIYNLFDNAEIPSLDTIVTTINNSKDLYNFKDYDFETIVFQTKSVILNAFENCYSLNENWQKALNLVSMLNKIDTLDINYINSNCNPIELIYRKEYSLIYSKLDSTSKQIFRKHTALIAKKRHLNECEVADEYLNLANKDYFNNKKSKTSHVGYYISRDYYEIYPNIKPKRYLYSIVALTFILTLLIIILTGSAWFWIFTLLPIYEISKLIINLVFCNNNEITYLPRYDFNGEIPNNCKTLAVISALINSPKEISSLKERLTRLYYTNPTDNLKICALCDLKESDEPYCADDSSIILNTEKMINKLNQELDDKFILIIRDRKFCKTQNKFTGYERKRGAIEQLVKFIKGENISFRKFSGDRNYINSVKYILALDYDTTALINTVSELVSISEYVLNQPEIKDGKVINGYGIIAPRITTQLKSSLHSPFAKLVGGLGSSNAYDDICSEIYQDTFHEGFFSGKGLIYVNAFYEVCCDYFKPETILSHDILEGCLLRTGFAGDVEFRDSFPSNSVSYFKRYHRWVRGDIQNSLFLFNKIKTSKGQENTKLSFLDRLKLAENLRRPLTFIAIFLLCLISIFTPQKLSVIGISIALSSLLLPHVCSFIYTIAMNGFYEFTDRYYSGAISTAKQILFQILYSILLLPFISYTSADAIIRSLIRMKFTQRNLLEWTTSSQTDKNSSGIKNFIRFAYKPFIISLPFLFSSHIYMIILGVIFLASPFILLYADKPYKKKIKDLPLEKINMLTNDVASMWQYYEDYATKKENYLPPDNVQFAPVFRICHRTSPTNIGLMMVSILVARDFELIDTKGLVTRLDNVLTSIEKMKKYKGNLYNWYETKTLELSNNPFVSSVDSGNFLCCMICLKEGLKEYSDNSSDINLIIKRIKKIIDDTDLNALYDKSTNLFSIGYNPAQDSLSENHYDMLMSEARMTSYFAVAKRCVPKKHWKRLARNISRKGLHTGAISYSGTMFEFFMPELFLQSEPGSLSDEALNYCIYCQKQRTKNLSIPYGISESAYYSFDNNLNYQYKAHGVQSMGLKQGLDSELVISPYSTYLTLSKDIFDAANNLERLKEYGMYGKYGLYEAIDFTPSRTSYNGQIIKSYMAHHIGMSIVGIANALHDNIIKKRFMNDKSMNSAKELLEEKVISGTSYYETNNDNQKNKTTKSQNYEPVLIDKFYPLQPVLKLLSNGEYSLILADSGASLALYQGKDVYIRTTDVLRRPQGCYFAVSTGNETNTPITYLPQYTNKNYLTVDYYPDSVCYHSHHNNILIDMKVFVHNNLPCELRTFSIKNNSSNIMNISLLSYIEPILSLYNEYNAHLTFSKLFLKEEYDIDYNCVIVSRKDRNTDNSVYCAIGFIEDINLAVTLSREDILNKPDGVIGVFLKAQDFIKNLQSIPDPAVFMKTDISLKPNETKECTLFILTSLKKQDLISNIARLRNEKKIQVCTNSFITNNSLEDILISTVLPQIIYKTKDCTRITSCIKQNTLSVNGLWSVGISGDLPIIYVEITAIKNYDRVSGYLRFYQFLKQCCINTDIIFSYNDIKNDEYNYEETLKELISKYNMSDSINRYGGIHLLNKNIIDSQILNLIEAVSVHIAPLSMIRIKTPVALYEPIIINKVNKVELNTEYPLTLGGFNKNTFVSNKSHKLPWCNIIANKHFGTLLSDTSLGFTYAVNSRENKLTPWYNDTMTDNRGEMLILRFDNKYYDLIFGSTAVFSNNKAIFYGTTDFFDSIVTVTISDKEMCKKISVELNWKYYEQDIQLGFYTEPVLGVNTDNSRLIKFELENHKLFIENPFNCEIQGKMCIASSKELYSYTTSKQQFLNGKWDSTFIDPNNNPCCALIINFCAKRNNQIKNDFFISFGRTKENAVQYITDFKEYIITTKNNIKITTPDKNLNNMFNYWLYHQTLSGRIYARTGFYQCSGAWGFRDQLQDSCTCLLLNPSITRDIILKACNAQFTEGDVLHWWHELDNKKIGVRTKYSDDLVWLAYTTCEYIEKTSDFKILSENIPYCDGITLNQNEHEKYGEVHNSEVIESVYNHCKRALSHAYKLGEHSLILMGGGDWNDSFNNVGIHGKGESVWLSQFMIVVFRKFLNLCKLFNDEDEQAFCDGCIKTLIKAIEQECWDGEWYIRAIFDNGDELGSKNCDACQIDSLAQSFAVLSQLPNDERNRVALKSAYSYLVDDKYGLIKLFTPPFRNNEMPVGYATSYPEGIRENGGQYTHGVIWLAIAMLEAGYTNRGYELIKLLNPANKYLDNRTALRFKNEPYFMSADIYTNPQCYGRAGWSIYTGAAGWYYRAIFEWLFGIKIKNNKIKIAPNLPKEWEEYDIDMIYNDTKIHIVIAKGTKFGMFDNDKPCCEISLDKNIHEVRVIVPRNDN